MQPNEKASKKATKPSSRKTKTVNPPPRFGEIPKRFQEIIRTKGWKLIPNKQDPLPSEMHPVWATGKSLVVQYDQDDIAYMKMGTLLGY